MWQYEFGKDYNHIPNPEEDDLDWVNDIASIPYTLLMDLRYEKKFIKEVKVESTFLLHD
ncbi:hypothetical protein AB3Z07_28050 (plasmid) [Metabacillus halosaccharovorans]|uniref:hypothetical protein n=1 Tax=Metabacillus halosaccharovorans TaxID=930124 RepID=UPI0034CFF50B